MPSVVRELARYGAKGSLTTTLNVLGMIILVELLQIHPSLAAIISTCTLLVLGYSIMNAWVFKAEESPSSLNGHLRRGAAYYTVILTGKAVNYALFLGLLAVGVWYPLAWLLGSATVFFGTFTANRWVWKHAAI